MEVDAKNWVHITAFPLILLPEVLGPGRAKDFGWAEHIAVKNLQPPPLRRSAALWGPQLLWKSKWSLGSVQLSIRAIGIYVTSSEASLKSIVFQDFFFFFTFGIRVIHSLSDTGTDFLPPGVRCSVRRWHPVTGEVNPALSLGSQASGGAGRLPHLTTALEDCAQWRGAKCLGPQCRGWGLLEGAWPPGPFVQTDDSGEPPGPRDRRKPGGVGEETLQRRGNKLTVPFSAHGRSGSLFHCPRVILLRFPGEF